MKIRTVPAEDIPAELLGDGIHLTSLHGRFDVNESPQFRSYITPVMEAGHPRLGIDLSDVEFIDSSALSDLVWVMKRTAEASVEFLLVSPSATVQVILELTCLDQAFKMVNINQASNV